jgi:serine protease Do
MSLRLQNGGLRRVVLGLILVAAAICGLRPAAASTPTQPVADLVASVMSSVVSIYVRAAPDAPVAASGKVAFNDTINERLGSGFIVDASGLIATNRHVVDHAYQILVTLSDGTVVQARLVGQTVSYDIALIRIDAPAPLQPVRFGDSDTLRVGDQVVAVGNPLGFGGTVTTGIISGLNRNINSSAFDSFIQTDASINHGNSGGPLFDMEGRAIGLNTAIFTLDGGSIGIGFAIPANDVKFVIDQVRRFGRPHIGWLGVEAQKVTPDMAQALALPYNSGLILSTITPASPAAAAGLQIGDVILRFGLENIEDMRVLNRAVLRAADQSVPIAIWRQGKRIVVPVAIKEMTQQTWRTDMEKSRVKAHLDVADEIGVKLGARVTDRVGLPVAEVAADSLAANAGIAAGDALVSLQFKPLNQPDDLQNELKGLLAKGHTSVLLLVTGAKGQRWVALKLQ